MYARDYYKTLFKEKLDGYITISNIIDGSITNATIKNYGELLAEGKKIVGLSNYFITPNTSYNGIRNSNNIRQFRALYIDLDYKNRTLYDINTELYDLCWREVIPFPTMLVDSGRGLHIYWAIENAPKQALYLWQQLEDYLYYNLKELGADKKATDSARLLRVPGTINIKNNKECNLIYSNPEYTYTLRELGSKYIKPKLENKPKKNKSVVITNMYNSYSLHMARISDLYTLLELREYKVFGYRNMFLHCYAYWIGIYTRDSIELKQKVIVFNNLFLEPLKDTEVNAVLRCIPKAIDKFIQYCIEPKKVTKTMQDRGGYWYKNSTLIEKLGITEEEEKHLKTIIGKGEKYNRNNKKRRESRRDSKGLTKREKNKIETTTKVQELKNKGIKQTEVAEQLGISVRTVKRYWNV